MYRVNEEVAQLNDLVALLCVFGGLVLVKVRRKTILDSQHSAQNLRRKLRTRRSL